LKTIISGEQLNFIVAVCAILISGASFYATYLQANSAEQQVKAMTWPLIEFVHGNFNVESREKNLTLTLRNAGVGPAIVKTVTFDYKDQSFPTLEEFIDACCDEGFAEYIQEVKRNEFDMANWTLTTSPTQNIILPVSGELDFLSLVNHPSNDVLWNAMNKERWKLKLDVCYCSLLENCYRTDQPGQVQEVASCGSMQSVAD
jgi:hypothetical protein